ncbi:unnamed protein product, partial [Allacma fusca]
DLPETQDYLELLNWFCWSTL